MSEFEKYKDKPIPLSKRNKEELEAQGFSMTVGNVEGMNDKQLSNMQENMQLLHELYVTETEKERQYNEAIESRDLHINNKTQPKEYYMDNVSQEDNEEVAYTDVTGGDLPGFGVPAKPKQKPIQKIERKQSTQTLDEGEEKQSILEEAATIPSPKSATEIDFTAYSTKDWGYVNLSELDSRGFGYPQGTELQIRSATALEMTYWGNATAENNGEGFESGLDILIANCVRMKVRGTLVDSRNIVYYDKFKLGLMIHHRTFPNGTNDIIAPFMHTENRTCVESEQELAVKPYMVSAWSMPEKYEKYYDKGLNVFNIPIRKAVTTLDKRKGIKGEVIDSLKLKLPTMLSVQCCEHIKSITAEYRERYPLVAINQFRFLPLDWYKYFKDDGKSTNAEKLLRDYEDFLKCITKEGSPKLWSIEKRSKIIDFQKAVDAESKPYMPIKTTCELCGGELFCKALFLKGYTSPSDLFQISDEE